MNKLQAGRYLSNTILFSIMFTLIYSGLMINFISSSPLIMLTFPFFIFLIFIVAHKNVTNTEMTIPLLLITITSHSIIVGGVNIGLSDVYLILIAIIALIKKNKIEVPSLFIVLVSLYLGYAFLSLSWTSDIKNAVVQWIQFLEFFVIGVIFFYNIGKQSHIYSCLSWYIYGTTILSIVAILYSASSGFSGPLYMFGFHKNQLGTTIGNAIPLICGFIALQVNAKNKFLHTLILLINSFALILTNSRGAMIGAIVGAIIVYLLMGEIKRLIIFIASGSLTIYMFVKFMIPDFWSNMTRFDSFSSAYSRVIIFEDVMYKIKQNLWFGHGLGSYFIRIPQINFKQDDPNNIFLRNLVELGIIGLILFAAILIYVCVLAIKNTKSFNNNKVLLTINAMCIGGFISQLVHNQVDVSWLRGTGIFMFGMVGIMLSLSKNFSIQEFNRGD